MTGTPSHAAYPEAGKNPGTALAELLLSIEALTKKIREQESFVLMTLIGMEIGSESYGVSASDGVLRLTVRGERESVFPVIWKKYAGWQTKKRAPEDFPCK